VSSRSKVLNGGGFKRIAALKRIHNKELI